MREHYAVAIFVLNGGGLRCRVSLPCGEGKAAAWGIDSESGETMLAGSDARVTSELRRRRACTVDCIVQVELMYVKLETGAEHRYIWPPRGATTRALRRASDLGGRCKDNGRHLQRVHIVPISSEETGSESRRRTWTVSQVALRVGVGHLGDVLQLVDAHVVEVRVMLAHETRGDMGVGSRVGGTIPLALEPLGIQRLVKNTRQWTLMSGKGGRGPRAVRLGKVDLFHRLRHSPPSRALEARYSGVKLERGEARDYRVAFLSRQPSVGRRSSNCDQRAGHEWGAPTLHVTDEKGSAHLHIRTFQTQAQKTGGRSIRRRAGERQKNRWNQRIREMTTIIMTSFRATSTAQQEAV
ncbi:hypothetical protein DFH08DRAFT_942374 [Mycena albidolilacea]|uniref:Uncharacterized protein n=1 Tax=Mycena albidolilacea TaxID=1033008 RepID=A0AAD7EGA6_9AGAR|nr:hypothetical protein DFH08DRAFT_942374 [Mycena albidolilacea]